MDPFEKLFTETLGARGRSLRTQETYVWMLRGFARFVAKPLDTVVPEDIQAYQRHLVAERKVGFSTFNQSTCALRFFYRECLLKTDWTFERMPYQRKRRVLPEILAPEEVAAIFDACSNLKHKAVLMTSYSGGLFGARRRGRGRERQRCPDRQNRDVMTHGGCYLAGPQGGK